MTSDAHGKLFVLVWSDDGVIKPVVLDTGALPVTESNPLTAINVTIKASDITLPVAEQSPLSELDVTIKASNITVPVAEQSPLTSLYAKQWTYWGGAWRSQPIIWSYTDRWAQRLDHTKIGDGDYEMNFTAVGAGQVYVLNTVVSRNGVRAVQQEYLITDGATWYPVYPYGTPGANVFRMSGYIQFVLKQGDWARVIFRSCINGDTLTGEVWGYKMQIS